MIIPGEFLVDDGEIELNAGRATCSVTVRNTGDRPIQVGSHYHFGETNAALEFDREAARGYRLNIASGTAVRFEPGQSRTVELVAYAGDRRVYGFRQQVMGPLDAAIKKTAKSKAAPTPAVARKSSGKTPAAKTASAKKTPAARKSPSLSRKG